jgi:outer membrane protein assembly factor BamB
VYGQVETGYDYPERGRGAVRPGKLARRWMIALIVGILAGAAIMLQVKGWWTLGSEAGGACGSGDNGVSYGACPRGITPALVLSFIVGFGAVPAALVLLFRPGWARRGFLVVGAAAGVVAGQALFGLWHGTDLAVAWAAPQDTSSQLSTVGAWTSGGSVIRVRVDEAVSYDAATGAQRWTLPVPGSDVACSVSNDTGTSGSEAIGLIAYGQDSTTCGHVMAVDLATGRQLWADPVPNPSSGNNPTGVLALAGSTAIVLTDEGIIGVDAQSGAQRWTASPPSDCSFQQVDGSGASTIAIAACAGSFWVVSLDPASGKAAWQYHVTEPSDSYQFQVLSVSPAVINDDLTGPRGPSTVRVFGPGGAVTATFPVSGIPDSAARGPLTLNTASTDGFGVPDLIAGGVLVGVASDDSDHFAMVAFSLSSGQRQWVTPLPDEVHDVTPGGGTASGQVVLVDESDPAYSLEEASVATGKLTSLGYFGQQALQSGDSGLYTAAGSGGTYYVIVNQDGSGDNPPAAGIRAPVVKG